MRHASSIKDRYFLWLCDFIGAEKNDLLEHLHSVTFVWVVSNDVNRAEDGRELRDRVLREHHVELPVGDELQSPDVSVLEVLAALADRLAFQTDETVLYWFEVFVDNLGIFDVPHTEMFRIDKILHDWMTRKIRKNGVGGLFPLRYPSESQQTNEIWDQMSEYLIEKLESEGFFNY